MQTKHYIWLAAVVGLAVGVGGWLLFSPNTTPSDGTSSTASTTDLGNGVSIQTTGSTTIEVIDSGSTTSSVKPPAISPLIFSISIPSELKVSLQAQYDSEVKELSVSPNRVDTWLKLGATYKGAGQYTAAAEAWSYVAKAAPSNISYIAYGNLGDLYMNFVKNYPRAEANLKAAIAIKPTYIDYYRNLVSLYTNYGYKTKADAQAVVTQGLKANPNNADLLVMQTQLNAQ